MRTIILRAKLYLPRKLPYSPSDTRRHLAFQHGEHKHAALQGLGERDKGEDGAISLPGCIPGCL